MGFWELLRAHPLWSAVGAVGTLVTVWGWAGDAREFWTAGVKPEYLQLFGFVLFALSVVSVIARQQQVIERRLTGVAAPPVEAPKTADPQGGYRRAFFPPDWTMRKTFTYIAAGSTFAGHSLEEVAAELRDKLHLNKLGGWGSKEPDGVIDLIPQDVWKSAELVARADEVVVKDGRRFYRVQFNAEEVRDCWPPKRNTITGY